MINLFSDTSFDKNQQNCGYGSYQSDNSYQSRKNQYDYSQNQQNYNRPARKKHEDPSNDKQDKTNQRQPNQAKSEDKNKFDVNPYEKVEKLLSTDVFEEITSQKLHFLPDTKNDYIVKVFSGNKVDCEKKRALKMAMKLWHPDRFFSKFSSRIPNEEEKAKIKTIVNHVFEALNSAYRRCCQ